MDKIVWKGEMDDGKAWIPNQSDKERALSSGTGWSEWDAAFLFETLIKYLKDYNELRGKSIQNT